MKKFFIIATSLFIIGICLPILAANSGSRCVKKKCRGEKAEWRSHHNRKFDCKRKKEAREAASIPLKDQNKQQSGISGNVKPKPEKEKIGTPNTSFNFLYYLFYKPSINEFLRDGDYCGPSPD